MRGGGVLFHGGCWMRFPARFMRAAASMAWLLPVCGFLPDAAQAPSADIIVTAAPVYEPLAALRGGDRFPKGAQLLLVHAGKAEPLVTGFAASADRSEEHTSELQ